eukprot:TRINITY_DN1182_c6_g1_i1.p1 TRINITY_DN1182_c6_g1~~TRINITY_DN1182_c6_g1_i1.p1  ORF type:complete len:749 (+),score=173.19 TRINITY_DN1182_c6_g1_i1:38-2284(+)
MLRVSVSLTRGTFKGAFHPFASRRWATEVPIERLRNFGISAHVDSGKTTLTERILYYTGKIGKMHEVNGKDGVGAVMDSMKQERQRGITIKSAATFSTWKDCWLNIIDTPGHIDFTVEVERSLRVLDAAILVVCAVGGVQSQTVTVDRQMKRYNVPRLIFINKIDRKESKPVNETIDALNARLGLNSALVVIPDGYGSSVNGCEGVIDIIRRKHLRFEGESGNLVVESDIPDNMKDITEETRLTLVEKLADVCDVVGDKFLEDEEPTIEEIDAAVRKGVLDRSFYPVYVGSAKANIGVQPLLDGVNRYLPSPPEVENRGIVVNDEKEETVVLNNNPKEDLVAMAFKLEEREGKNLAYVRVYQGTLKKGDTVRLAPRGSANWKDAKTGKVGRLVRVHSDAVEDVERIRCGEIAAVEGIDCASGDTLVNAKQKTLISCESIFVPDPVISIQLIPKEQGKIHNLLAALKKFEKEDPTFRKEIDPETNELTIAGMGELHLDIFIDRLKDQGILVDRGPPFVQFREYLPIDGEREYDYRHKKQTGGRGQFAQFSGVLRNNDVELSSSNDTEKSSCINDQPRPILPMGFVQSIKKAFGQITEKGPLLGLPVWGLEMTITGGQTHEVDSSDAAFNIAVKDFITQQFLENKGHLLEPVMTVEVVGPNGSARNINDLIMARHGEVTKTVAGEVDSVLHAEVPLRHMFGFISELRSATSGSGEFSMEYSHHIPVPHHESVKIIADRKADLAAKENRKD